MKAKDVIKGIEEGFDDNEQIAGAVAWVEDAESRLGELLQDNLDMQAEFEAMQAELAALKAEIDRLKTESAEVKTRFGELLQQEFRGHQLQDRMMFTVKGREIIDWWVALNSPAIAKARGES